MSHPNGVHTGLLSAIRMEQHDISVDIASLSSENSDHIVDGRNRTQLISRLKDWAQGTKALAPFTPIEVETIWDLLDEQDDWGPGRISWLKDVVDAVCNDPDAFRNNVLRLKVNSNSPDIEHFVSRLLEWAQGAKALPPLKPPVKNIWEDTNGAENIWDLLLWFDDDDFVQWTKGAVQQIFDDHDAALESVERS
jgi:hypothetical protein